MTHTRRLDRELVARGLAVSRTRAAEMIRAGEVTVEGRPARKASAAISSGQHVEVSAEDPWVSRAAHKLLGALQACPAVEVSDRRCLDAGASTGGFTQVLLAAGAAEVVAVDVGHDQISPALRDHPRVQNIEGLNLREVRSGQLGDPFEVIVADLSFISLQLVMPSLTAQASPGADLLLMIKPQFEVGRQRLGRTGVVTSPQLRREAVHGVVASAATHGLVLHSVHRSGLPGQDGNLEFFVHLTRPQPTAPQISSETTPEVDTSVQADRLDQVDYRD